MNRVFLSVILVLASIVCTSEPTRAQSIYLDVSNSSSRSFGLGLGGALRIAGIGIGDLDAYAGVRNFFVDQENTTAIGIQAGLDLILRPEIVDSGGVVARPVVAVGVDFERQTFDFGNMTDSVNDTGMLVLGGIQIKPKRRVLGIPLLADIGVLRTFFHDNDVTEVRARLHILLSPTIIIQDEEE
jgi:hypothetical protein